MEYWVEKLDDVLIYISDEDQIYKIDLIPSNPLFLHSIFPVPHGIRVQQSR